MKTSEVRSQKPEVRRKRVQLISDLRSLTSCLFTLALLLFTTTPVRSQISLPITGTVIVPTNAITAIYLTIVTNVIVTNVFVTNLFVTNVIGTPPSPPIALAGTVIDPAIGPRLVKTVTGPLTLTLLPFADTNWTTLFLQNPSKFPVVWPTTNAAGALVNYRTAAGPSSPPGTNDDWPVVLFESVLGRLTGTQ